MKTDIFSSNKTDFLSCLEDIKLQINKNYDFLLFAIHPKFGYENINSSIIKIFNTNNYAAFHAIDAFKNNKISETIVCLGIEFERKAKINTFYIEDIMQDKTSLQTTINYLNSNSNDFHIVLAGFANERFTYFIEEVSSKINYYPVNNIIGGISSGIEKGEELLTYQFIDNKIIKNGFMIISFENVEAVMEISLGFVPYGITYRIQKVDGNKLQTVDGGRNFRDIIDSLLEGIENPDVKYLWYLPINILDEDDGYVSTLRTVADIEENSVKFFAPLKKGQKFKLSFATAYELIAEDIKCAKNIKEHLKEIDIAFNFSCIARQYVLEDKQEEEIKKYTSILDSKLFGFFTFGEIGPDKQFKKLKLYNETSLIVGMREK